MKKYQIIYADPPWDYGSKTKTIQGLASKHYPVMRVDDICRLKVKEITDKNCALFLWVTPPHLKSGIKVMESWGFKYGTIGFVWVKTNPKSGTPVFGIGHWTASNCELVLVGLKIGSKLVRANKNISQVVISPRREHSQKPDEVRKRIVDLMGDLPRIELFARGERSKDLFEYNRYDGWDCWGNEVESDIDLIKC